MPKWYAGEAMTWNGPIRNYRFIATANSKKELKDILARSNLWVTYANLKFNTSIYYEAPPDLVEQTPGIYLSENNAPFVRIQS